MKNSYKHITVGSLFSGIGGMDLGLERAGLKTVWQVEFDDWRREQLTRIFPHTEKFKDVRECGAHNLPAVDLICGGFPCQDVSISNVRGVGLDGERSGLWSEFFRIVCEIRPAFVLVENVANLAVRGLGRVLGDLASVGFDAEWQTLRASDFGLPHKRPRLFILAYTGSIRRPVLDPDAGDLPQNDCGPAEATETVFNLSCGRHPSFRVPSDLCVDYGVSAGLSEISNAVTAYGNAVVPSITEWIGRRIQMMNDLISDHE